MQERCVSKCNFFGRKDRLGKTKVPLIRLIELQGNLAVHAGYSTYRVLVNSLTARGSVGALGSVKIGVTGSSLM